MDRTAYEQFYELDKNHFWRIAKRKLVTEWIDKYWSESAICWKICDIGGACSLLTRDLKKYGTVVSVEPDSQTAQSARSLLGLDVIEGAVPSNVLLFFLAIVFNMAKDSSLLPSSTNIISARLYSPQELASILSTSSSKVPSSL